MPRAGFELATPATKRPQTYALDRAAAGIGTVPLNSYVHCTRVLSHLYEYLKSSVNVFRDGFLNNVSFFLNLVYLFVNNVFSFLDFIFRFIDNTFRFLNTFPFYEHQFLFYERLGLIILPWSPGNVIPGKKCGVHIYFSRIPTQNL
jgi:hypothetical protein